MIGLVSCAAKKLDHPAPARHLYTSALFRMSLKYAEAHCSTTYILSALYGLVPLDAVIAPYDVRLKAGANNYPWALDVVRELAARHPRGGDLLLLAGAVYVDPLLDALDVVDWRGQVIQPLEGLQIGERLSWLSKRTKGLGR